ncbi:MAG: choice-of-anchor B family protein, partial [Bacteroidetes bacterium]
MKKGLLVKLLLLSGIHLTFAQAQKNMTLVGQLPYPAAELSNIWGYVDPQGREYALVGLTTGVSVVDLQNPAQPVEIQRIPGAVSDWREIKTWQNFAYATNETGGGLLIMDLSGLPDTITYKDTVLAGINTAHTLWIDDGWLYLNGPDQFEGGTAIFNLNPHPDRPVLTGTYEQAYVHDMYSRGDTAYLAEILEGTFTLLDISDRSNPEVIVTVGYPNAFTHNTWLNDAGTVCFTTDELPAASIIAWDISNPANIRQLDNIRSGLSKGKAIPHNVHVRNDYLISSYYRDGVHITDASRPGNMVEVGYYDTSPLENEGFNGVWGVYPFLPSGLILASDIEGGLFVLQASLRRASWLEGSITDGETGELLGDVELILGDSLSQEKSRTDGSYAMGIADPGTYTIALYKYGYERDTLTVQLDSAIVTPLDIVLTPSPRVDVQVQIREALSLAGIGGATLLARSLDGATEQTFSTDASGNLLLERFVVNDYQFIAGKWGYLSAEQFLQPDSNNNQITFLLQKGYADDFSLDLGWKVQSDLLRGAWEKGKPIT